MRHDHAERIADRWMDAAPGAAEGDQDRRKARREHAADALARLLPAADDDEPPPFAALPMSGDHGEPPDDRRWLSHECLVLAGEDSLYRVAAQEGDREAEAPEDGVSDLVVFVRRLFWRTPRGE